MKEAERKVWITLSSEINATLCSFCRHGSWVGEGCCEGYCECDHPIEALSYANSKQEDLTPGDDCYLFSPNMTYELFVEIVSQTLSLFSGGEWSYINYGSGKATVYGKTAEHEKGIKVRINLQEGKRC